MTDNTRKPMIVLQTDFSLSWGAVSEMKGIIKMVDRDLEIFDSCHEIKQYDPWEASLNLNAVEPFWPKGTIFISVVDPGVGTSRKACIALLNDGNYVVTPDNGTLTHMLHHPGIQEVREIDESINRCHPKEAVSVFEGRDVFAYCGARLASGLIAYEETGKKYSVSEIIECREYYEKPVFHEHFVECFIMTGLKHFGGIQFNVTNADWRKLNLPEGTCVHVAVKHKEEVFFERDVAYARSFGYVGKGDPVLYCGSSLYLSLDLNQGNLMEKYHIGTGLDWKAVLSF